MYVETYDKQKGYLARRFRADTYTPRPDGAVDVTQPEAEFYTESGQMFRVRGDTGQVVVPAGNGSGGSAGADPMGRPPMPTRGRLNDVTITFFPPGAHWPTFTCRTPNVTFDNDTFLIQTEQFSDAQGRTIAETLAEATGRREPYGEASATGFKRRHGLGKTRRVER